MSARRLRAKRTHAAGDEAFALVELLVVMTLLMIVGGIVVAGLVQGMRTTAYGEARVEALADTRTGLERISREVRAADPLVVADSDHVEVSIRRDERLFHYIYSLEPSGDRWDLTEERRRFDDGFDDPGFDPQTATPDAVTERVLVPDLVTDEVFTFSGRQVDIRLERLVEEGRNPIVVETTVTMRNE